MLRHNDVKKNLIYMEILGFYAEQEIIVLCISMLTTRMQVGKGSFIIA